MLISFKIFNLYTPINEILLMYRMLLSRIASTLILLFITISGYAQTTVTAATTAANTTGSPGAVTFAVTNTNTYAVAITQVAAFHNALNNGRTYTVWYHPTALTGTPSISTANGWIQLGVTAPISATTGITTLLTNKYLIMQPNATYRFAVTINSGNMYYYNAGTTSYSNGGVSILTGANTTSPSYSGTLTNTNNSTNVYFAGSVTFVTASVNNVGATLIVNPLNNSQICYGVPTLVRAVIYNSGASAQSNIPVGATYVSSTSSFSISSVYANSLAPYTSDTVNIGTINPIGGTYTIRAYTQLASDTIKVNDTSGSLTFTYKPMINPPVTFSDTVCPGHNAFLSVDAQTGTVYNWYSAQTGGVLVNIGNNQPFVPLTQDTTMYIAAQVNGCESDRTPVTGIIGAAPIVDFGPDTSFCESEPLILDAGNPGAKYLWNTGDTTQTITITNQSGDYIVTVDKYCAVSDTINVSIAPLPSVSGISYIRTGNTYQFSASSVQHVTDYLWIFGDGNTSTLPSPTHYYGPGINAVLTVKLVVSNACGTDTAFRSVPTGVNELGTLENKINVYPNPASDYVYISSASAGLQSVQVVNMMGEVVLSASLNKTTDTRIDTRNLSQGNYILRVTTEATTSKLPLQIIK